MDFQLPKADMQAGGPIEQSTGWDGEQFMNFNASDNTADSSSFQLDPPLHSAESNAQASSVAHNSHGPLATFGNHLADVGTYPTPDLSQTNNRSTRVANAKSYLGPNPFLSGHMPALTPMQHDSCQQPQAVQSFRCPPDNSRTNFLLPTHRFFDASRSNLTNQIPSDDMSTDQGPRKRRKRKRDGETTPNQDFSSIPANAMRPQNPDWHLICACILYMSCNSWIKPLGTRMGFLSELFPNTPEETFHEIFDQHPNPSGNALIQFTPLPYQKTSTSTQKTPHQVARAACNAWRSWWVMHAGGIPSPEHEWPSKVQILLLADLYHEDWTTIESYLGSNCHLVEGTDSAYGTLTNTFSVKDAAGKLQGKHNCCVKEGEKETRALEARRGKGRDSNKKYICIECFRAFKRDSDFRRHERERCIYEVWLCCLDACQPDPKYYWKREGDFWEKHVKVKHKNAIRADVEKCYAEIVGNFRRTCILQECHLEVQDEFQTFEESFQHIKRHMESKSWDFSHVRRDADSTGVSKERNALQKEDSDAEHSEDDGSSDSDDGGDDDGPPNAGQSSASAQGSGGPYKPGSGYVYPPASNFNNAGFSDHFYGSSQGSSAAQHALSPPSLELVRQSIPALWSLDDFLRIASPASPKLNSIGYLGYGSSAVIDEIRIQGFSSTMARKTFRHIQSVSKHRMCREVESMSKLQHPHVVEIVAPYQQAQSVGILMHPVADCNLSQYLSTCSGRPNERQNILLWFSCLSTGLEHIHGHGVYHFDIKPSNILVKDGNVLFADFGASTTIARAETDKDKPTEFTMLYAAPEMLKGERKSKSDIFSLGCVFLEMANVLLSTELWHILRQHQQKWRGLYLAQVHWAITWKKILKGISKLNKVQQLLDVFDGIFELAPDERPSATEIKNRVNTRTRLVCEHDVHQSPSAQEYVFHVPTRASTWPQDRASLRREWAESTKRLRIIAANDILVLNDTYLSRKAFVVQHTWPEGIMTMSIDMETAITPIHATPRSGGHDSKGIDLRSMMWYFLHQLDTHERFRASGQATAARATKWAETFEGPQGMYVTSELRKLTLELSAMSIHEYGERKEPTNGEWTIMQTNE